MSLTLLLEQAVPLLSSEPSIVPESALPAPDYRRGTVRLLIKRDNENGPEQTELPTKANPPLDGASARKAHLVTWLPLPKREREMLGEIHPSDQTVPIAALEVPQSAIPRFKKRITPLGGPSFNDRTERQEDEKQLKTVVRMAKEGMTPQRTDTVWIDMSLDFIWPVREPVMTSGFGPRWGSYHYGLDMISRQEDPTIVAARSGHVVFSERVASGYGNLIILDHGDGLTTYYAHLKKRLVKEGDFVRAGTPIGIMGSIGHTTGVHLHFEIRDQDVPQDPLHYLRLTQPAMDDRLTVSDRLASER
ncbi:MAG: putative peptidase [Candidatus Carbobacillus altaicus]|uniref:Putative peptidase n=1 Tax=Candidatus Carbonibacillus altaicus TaxID=2163959 RepID=A0A2R6Y445_9BACL|nr:MAG: putative peptidase [Candidatus Carbobacillus altaicus]